MKSDQEAIAVIEKIESSLTSAKWALKQYKPLMDKNTELTKENRVLKKEIELLKNQLERQRKDFELSKQGLITCPDCDGAGGWLIDQGPECPPGEQDCQTCKTSGVIELEDTPKP